jgi:hypothetical protein
MVAGLRELISGMVIGGAATVAAIATAVKDAYEAVSDLGSAVSKFV